MEERLIADQVSVGNRLEHVIEATDEEGRAGIWLVKRPSVGEECLIGVRYAQLRTPPGGAQPVPLDEDRDYIAFAAATLSVVIAKRPEWFPKEPAECRDTALIVELFTAYRGWLDSFRRPVSGAAAGDSGTP